MITINKLGSGSLAGVLEIVPRRLADERGFFSETYSAMRLAEAGLKLAFVQENHALSRRKGTVRGLHFQAPPAAQSKLIRVVRGAVLDVAVDIRRGSPSYGRHVSLILSAEKWNQILVPAGFAHGFCTIEPDTEVLYKVDAPYDPKFDFGLRWNDLALAISWPVEEADAVLSEKDKALPLLKDLPHYFDYDRNRI